MQDLLNVRTHQELPFTWQAAEDRAAWSKLRNAGFPPLTKGFKWPGSDQVPA